MLGLMCSMVSLAADPAPAAKPTPVSNKWRIELDGKADVDGEIVLAIVLDGVTTNVTTKVPKGKGENAVAKLIRDQLKVQAPPKHFHVEIDDGEDVLIKKKLGMASASDAAAPPAIVQTVEASQTPRLALPEKAPKDEAWIAPFGPLTTKAAKAAGLSRRRPSPTPCFIPIP